MTIDRIEILNFKNIPAVDLQFSTGVNCLLGMNGMGKSNLLDAVHYLCMTRPMTGLTDQALIRHGENMLLVKGDFHTDAGSSDTVSIGLTRGGRGKTLKRNGKEYNRISEHIGRYPVVTVTPADTRLVDGTGEERRKLMDMVISQARPDYLTQLMRYNRSLESRNRMLRAGVRDSLLFESVETAMEQASEFVAAARREWVEGLAPAVAQRYAALSGFREKTTIAYRTQLEGTTLKKLLAERRQKDSVLGFTSAGIHRDDLDMKLDGYSIRRLGSQGQVKTFTIALRLAVFDYIRRESGMTPLLLLDDIFDKLDADRVANIMTEVTHGDFGQIFITDTNRKHLDSIMDAISGPQLMLNVENGTFQTI